MWAKAELKYNEAAELLPKNLMELLEKAKQKMPKDAKELKAMAPNDVADLLQSIGYPDAYEDFLPTVRKVYSSFIAKYFDSEQYGECFCEFGFLSISVMRVS